MVANDISFVDGFASVVVFDPAENAAALLRSEASMADEIFEAAGLDLEFGSAGKSKFFLKTPPGAKALPRETKKVRAERKVAFREKEIFEAWSVRHLGWQRDERLGAANSSKVDARLCVSAGKSSELTQAVWCCGVMSFKSQAHLPAGSPAMP